MTDKPFAAALKAARKRLGISMYALAHRAGIHKMGPSRWERGALPLALQLPIIAKAYKIPEEELHAIRFPRRTARRSKAPSTSSSMPLFKRL